MIISPALPITTAAPISYKLPLRRDGDFCALCLSIRLTGFDPLYALTNQDAASPPPSLAAFSPTERGVVVYTGYAAQKELAFYCLRKKQVRARARIRIPAPPLALSKHLVRLGR